MARAEEVHGPGTSRVTWCDNSVYMLTTGMSKLTREREFAVWDARSLSAPMSRTRVGGTSSGFLLPRLQFGLGLVTLCGRGDSTVRRVLEQSVLLTPTFNGEERQSSAGGKRVVRVHFARLNCIGGWEEI